MDYRTSPPLGMAGGLRVPRPADGVEGSHNVRGRASASVSLSQVDMPRPGALVTWAVLAAREGEASSRGRTPAIPPRRRARAGAWRARYARPGERVSPNARTGDHSDAPAGAW